MIVKIDAEGLGMDEHEMSPRGTGTENTKWRLDNLVPRVSHLTAQGGKMRDLGGLIPGLDYTAQHEKHR